MTRRAFTLLEVLVALALTIVLSGVAYALLWNLVRDRGAILARIETGQDAGDLLDAIEADVESAFVEDPTLGAGLRGDSSSLRVLTRGVHLRAAASGDDPASRDVALSDTIEAQYQFSDNRALRRSSLIDALGARHAPDERAFAARGFRLRYHDGTAWRSSFDSRAAGFLPVAIEVRLFTETDPNPPAVSAPAPDAAQTDSQATSTQQVSSTTTASPAPDRSRVIAIPDGGPGRPASAPGGGS